MRTVLQPAPNPQNVVHEYVNRALRDRLPGLPALRVIPFGSRVYEAAGPMSDYDFYLELPKGYGAQGKILRACIRQHLIDD